MEKSFLNDNIKQGFLDKLEMTIKKKNIKIKKYEKIL